MPQIIPEGFVAIDMQIRYAPNTHLDHNNWAVGVSSSADLPQLANDVLDACEDTYTVLLSENHTIERVRCYTESFEGFSTGAALPGGGTTDILPANCAWLVQKRGVLTGRANRGRVYVPGPSEAAVDGNGLIESAVHASVDTAMNDFLSQMQAIATVENVVILHSSAEQEPTPVLTLHVDPHIATQRRRMRS